MSEAKSHYRAIAMLQAQVEESGLHLDHRVCELHHHHWIKPGQSLMFEVTHGTDKHKVILFRDGTAIAKSYDKWLELNKDGSKQMVDSLHQTFSESGKWKKETTAVLCLRDAIKPLKPSDLHMIYENHTTEPKPVRGFDLA